VIEMARTATKERKTQETEIRLELDLDGGEAAISTGVGFLDHMLELLARHGHLGLRVEASGDLETGAHHTVEASGSHSAGRSTKARDRPDPALRLGDGRGAGSVRARHLGRPLCPSRPPAPVAIAGFDVDLTRSSFAPWRQREDHCTSGPLRLERPSHVEAASRRSRVPCARVSVDPDERGAEQGDAERVSAQSAAAGPRICVLDYGMGNLRSVEKALDTSGPGIIDPDRRTPTACCRGGGVPKAIERIRERGSGADRRRLKPGQFLNCLGFSCCSNPRPSWVGAASA
jgi:imidazoleglycerol-phosphate dehydratase